MYTELEYLKKLTNAPCCPMYWNHAEQTKVYGIYKLCQHFILNHKTISNRRLFK